MEPQTITGGLEKLAQDDPLRPAFIFWDKNLKRTAVTRQDVWDKSRKCAAFLRREGVRKGDVVCNTLLNSQERLITMYGTIIAGGVTMHGQKLLADCEDIIKNIEDAQCKFVLADPNEMKGIDCILEKKLVTDEETGKIRYQGLSCLNKVIHIHHESWLHLLDKEQEMYMDNTITDDDAAMVMVTSGSTGFAKVVPHTHASLALTAGFLKHTMKLDDNSVCFNEGSLGWLGGSPIMYPYIGLARVLGDWMPGPVKNRGAFIVHVLEHEPCDTAHVTPFEIGAVLNHMDAVDKQSLAKTLRVMLTGGGPVSKSTVSAIGRICDCVSVAYGASEIGIIYGHNLTDPSQYENACCGYPAQNIEAKIVDKNLKQVAPCETGEVLLRSPSLFKGYLNNPEANKSLLADGWWRSSDIGHINEKGQLFVYCRKSNVINYKTYMYHPGWMEARIDRHPCIKKCFVLGLPHPTDNSEICLCISKTTGSKLTAEEVREYYMSLFLTTEDQSITPIPKYIMFFDSLPQKGNGKVDRKTLKEMAVKRAEVDRNA